MKALLFCIVVFLVVACSQNKVIDGKLYETYGLLNKDEIKIVNVQYRLVVGNVVWGCLLFETIVALVYFFGFDIYEPVAVIPK